MEICDEKNTCGGRREFLVRASATVGGLMLSLSSAAIAQKKDEMPKTADGDSNEAVLKLDEKSPLNKVGGFDTMKIGEQKVVVVRTSETDFKAYSAVCPHKGGPIKYDAEKQQLFCPWHGSRFDMTGAVVKPPAQTGLTNFATEKAIVVELKMKA